jgi:hypothetical protein
MKRSSLSPRPVLILVVLILFSLACSLTSGAKPVPTTRPTREEVSTRETQPTQEAQPTQTVAAVTVDDITVDYVYTSELITVINHLYGSVLDDFVIVTIKNDANQKARVVVESEIVGYTNKAIDTVDVEAGETVEVRQNPRLIASAIDQLNSEKPADFHIRMVYLDNGEEREILDQTNSTLVFSRRDFPWAISGFTQAEVYDLLAAMVTPQDPAVEELIRKAADYTSSGIIASGYGGAENDANGTVWDRLQAIWQAEEKNYNLTYISTFISFAPGDVQRIRLPAEVLDQKSGNCIELALLYAAAAEAMYLDPAIILIPGHAYVAVRTDMVNAKYYFIETTLIGRSTFKQAVDSGNSEYEDASPHLEAHEESYGWVTISETRTNGILPIPWN